MKKNALFLVAAVLLSLALVMVAGCDDDDENIVAPTVTSEPFVSAIIGNGMRMKADDGPPSAMVMVTNFTDVPGVTVNGDEIGVEPEFSFYGGGMGFAGSFNVSNDMMANLVVGFGEGVETGTASVAIPGTNEEVGETNINISEFEGFSATWTTSERAEKYMVSGYFDGNYTDNDDNGQSWDKSFSYITTDTTISVTAEQIWPAEADVQYINNFWGDLDVMPINGPMEAGEPTNITGGCRGIMVSYGDFLDWDFNWDSPSQDPALKDNEADVDWPALLMGLVAPR